MADTLRAQIAQALHGTKWMNPAMADELAVAVLPLVEQAIQQEREKWQAEHEGPWWATELAAEGAETKAEVERLKAELAKWEGPNDPVIKWEHVWLRMEKAESALADKDAQIAALREADQVLTIAVKASEENWGWAFNEMTDEQGEALNAFFVSVSKVLRETPAPPQEPT